MVVNQLPRLGKRELICLLLFTCNYVVFVWRGFLFLWVLGMGYVILLWHSLSLPYNYLLIMAVVVSNADISRKIPNYFKFVKKMNINVRSFLSSQNIFHDLKGPKGNIICTIDF